MSDATKKANLKYLLFQESPAIFFPSVLENVFLVLRRAWRLKGDFAQEVCVFSLVVVVYLDVDYG